MLWQREIKRSPVCGLFDLTCRPLLRVYTVLQYAVLEPISARQVQEGGIYKHTVNQRHSNRLLFAVLSYNLLMDCNMFDFKLSTFFTNYSRGHLSPG